MTRIASQGSERAPLPGARALRPAAADGHLEVSRILRPGAPGLWRDRLGQLGRGQRAALLGREQFAQTHGAGEGDLRVLGAFSAVHGLAVVRQHPARRTVILSGTVDRMNAAFGVELLYPAIAFSLTEPPRCSAARAQWPRFGRG